MQKISIICRVNGICVLWIDKKPCSWPIISFLLLQYSLLLFFKFNSCDAKFFEDLKNFNVRWNQVVRPSLIIIMHTWAGNTWLLFCRRRVLHWLLNIDIDCLKIKIVKYFSWVRCVRCIFLLKSCFTINQCAHKLLNV